MGGPVEAIEKTADGLAGSLKVFHGFHVDAGAAAEIQIRDGSAAGKLLASSRLGAAGDDGPHFFERGITTANGIWVEFVGASGGSVTIYGV